jgi:MFS family permease
MPRLAAASLAGTAIEFYDFFVYGTAAALVLGPLFFPTFSPVAGTLAAFGTFGVGFVARPLGSVLFGHIGDRHGRRPVLVLSLLLTGARPSRSAAYRRTTRSVRPLPCCSLCCVSCRGWGSAGSGAGRCC